MVGTFTEHTSFCDLDPFLRAGESKKRRNEGFSILFQTFMAEHLLFFCLCSCLSDKGELVSTPATMILISGLRDTSTMLSHPLVIFCTCKLI